MFLLIQIWNKKYWIYWKPIKRIKTGNDITVLMTFPKNILKFDKNKRKSRIMNNRLYIIERINSNP